MSFDKFLEQLILYDGYHDWHLWHLTATDMKMKCLSSDMSHSAIMLTHSDYVLLLLFLQSVSSHTMHNSILLIALKRVETNLR